MPLTHTVKPKTPIFSKIGQAIQRSFQYFRPEIILVGLLIVSIILAFLQVSANSFYILVGMFIIGYFAERIAVKIWKQKLSSSLSEKSKNP